MVCTPQKHGPEIPLCNRFYVLLYSPVPRQEFSGSEKVQTMVLRVWDHAGTGDHASFDSNLSEGLLSTVCKPIIWASRSRDRVPPDVGLAPSAA